MLPSFLPDFLFAMFLAKPIWMWLVFAAIVLALLVLDLGVLHKKDREIAVRESLLLSAGYISVGLLFGAWIYSEMGPERASEYITGFVLEKTLAMDNIFIMAMIFSALAIPRVYQHRVLFWGILGVIVLRGMMIGFGATLVAKFHWLLYIFSAFLILTGVKMFFAKDNGDAKLEDSKLYQFLRRHLPVTDSMIGHDFVAKIKGKNFLTPVGLALVMIELVDLIFAVDSVPAVLAITTDPYIVYTSNIFAVLGLRALYFALAAMINRFHYLKYALATLLVFIGAKIFVADFLGLAKFPAGISLGITLSILTLGVVVSLIKTRDKA